MNADDRTLICMEAIVNEKFACMHSLLYQIVEYENVEIKAT